MVPLLPTDQTGARALAPHPVIGERDLARGVDRLRSAVGEEHVVEIPRHQSRQPGGQVEGPWMAHLEGGRIVHLRRLVLDRLDDPGPAVAGITHHSPDTPSRIWRPSCEV